jgi:ParB-like chromosome segregation protein Spo0J
MQIPLSDLHPNPYRDFDLHPFDPVQVDRLKASIEADGFWASVVARKAPGGYQIAFGHHRIEAARQLGMAAAPIEVRALSDWQMVRMLVSENATQRGSTAAAALDAVAAIAQVVAYSLLRWDEATFAEISAKVRVNYASCRGRLEAGEGIGRDCIQAFAPEGALTPAQIEAALGTLKDSGLMASIIAAASATAEAELHAEQEEAERALTEAEAREADAADEPARKAAAKRTRQAKLTASKRRRATEATGKAAAAVRRKPIVYDARCAQLFRLDSHAEAFRKTVTGDTFRSYLPLDRQFEFAINVLATIRENNPPHREVTVSDIRSECWARIESGLGMSKMDLRTAPERPYHHEVKDGLNFIRRAVADGRRGFALLASAQRKGEVMNAAEQQQLARYFAAFDDWMAMRRELVRKLQLVGA